MKLVWFGNVVMIWHWQFMAISHHNFPISHHTAQCWQIGDTLIDRYLGRGVVTENTPQITVLVGRGVARFSNPVKVSGSQSSLMKLGWSREAGEVC